jgi:sugar phosphate isomerase/epimerase
MSTFPQDRLALNGGTLRATPILEQFEAAADAGFRCVSIWMRHITAHLRAGGTIEELEQALERLDLRVLEVDHVAEWIACDAAALEPVLTYARGVFDAARRLDCDLVVASTLGDPVLDLQRAIANYGTVCDVAGEYGIRVALEFLPWTAVVDIATAREIVHGAARENGGILVDAFHFFRGTARFDELEELPVDEVLLVHLDDLADIEGDLLTLTSKHRLMPGEGDFDLPRFVDAFGRKGYTGPYAVEILSDELDTRPATETARRAMASVQPLLPLMEPAR